MVSFKIFGLLSCVQTALAGTYSQVTNFGSNPTGTKIYQYVPSTLAANPAIIVAIHYCTGTAEGYYTGTQYAQYADTYGYIVLYPESPYSGTCHDVSSKATLTHGGGGESNSIANAATWAISQYNADPNKVFVTGSSSGAMMTNVLAATYPDIFKAGTLYSGVAAGCFYSSSGGVDAWNSTCANGQSIATPQLWGDIARAMYPGFTGTRPKMRIYHGDIDATLLPPNYNETIKQWSNVFGYTTTPIKTETNTPLSGYTRYTFGSSLQGIYAHNVGHTVPVEVDQDLDWFGIAPLTPASGSATTTLPPASGGASTTLSTSAIATTTAAGSSASSVAQYGQCGGIGYLGSTTCVAPYTCVVANSYYSQCK